MVLLFVVMCSSEYIAIIKLQYKVSSPKVKFSGPSIFSSCSDHYNWVELFKKELLQKVTFTDPICAILVATMSMDVFL